jgi:hypothetical protein
MENMLKYDFMKYGIVCFIIELHQFTSGKESLFMLPKGNFICMLKKKSCVASFRFLTIITLFVFVFFLFTPSIESTCICKNAFTWDYLNLEIFKIFYLLGFGIFTGFGHFQTSETSSRNMAVVLWYL